MELVIDSRFGHLAVFVETDMVEPEPFAIHPTDAVITLVTVSADHRRAKMYSSRATIARMIRIVQSMAASYWLATRNPTTVMAANTSMIPNDTIARSAAPVAR